MKLKKSHFRFSHQQRNGIFLLSFLIIVVQGLYFYLDASKLKQPIEVHLDKEVQQKIDSLKAIAKLKSGPKIYPFNPNFITDFKGYTLGMSPEEIDRLHNYRDHGQWINSARQFQQVTGLSDSLLDEIKPYFKFPDFIRNKRSRKQQFTSSAEPRSFGEKIDLNKATAEQLRMVNGIGEVLSERIIKYRNSFPGGFIADVQLNDIYGLSPEVINRVRDVFTVKTPRQVEQFNLNTATAEQLVTVQHIDYELADEIIRQRTLREGFKSWEELTKVKAFPKDKIEIIRLYLWLD